jgi:hypothetical protein
LQDGTNISRIFYRLFNISANVESGKKKGELIIYPVFKSKSLSNPRSSKKERKRREKTEERSENRKESEKREI